jgi:hypothetical protein
VKTEDDTNHTNGMLKGSLPHVWAVVWRVFAVLAALEVGYLLLANVLLLTPAVRSFATNDDMRLKYDWAFSPWPGHVVVRNMSLRFQDHNVQFLVGIERGSLDLSLHELVSKRFHLVRVDADEVSYRMRHKVSRVGLEGPRLAAYPPIEGFRDPPLFDSPPSPEIPDSKYDLWDVRVENIAARVKEVWILEYRYRGGGIARGNFHVKPGRWYEVYPASLELHGGKLTLGDTMVAEHANLSIDCQVEGSDPRQLEGLDPFHKIHAGARGWLAGTDLAFLDAYLGPRAGLSATGSGNVQVDAKLERGIVAPGTDIQIRSPEGSLGNEHFRVEGASEYRLRVPAGAKQAPMELGFRSPRLTILAAAGNAPPRFEHIDASIHVTPDLTSPLALVGADLAPVDLDVPDLAWISRSVPGAPPLSGRAVASLQAHRDAQGAWSGTGHAVAPNLSATVGKAKLGGNSKLDVTFASTPKDDNVKLERLNLEIVGGTLAVDERASKPWSAVLKSNDVEVETKKPLRARGTLELHADDANALMPLVVESPLARQLESTLLGLKGLDAKALFRLGDISRLELVRARAGIAQARGVLSVTKGGPVGAFLVSTGVANVGVKVRSGETSVVLFVGDNWLDKQPVAHRNASP